MFPTQFLRGRHLLTLRFTGKARDKKIYIDNGDYQDAISDLRQFFLDVFSCTKLPENFNIATYDGSYLGSLYSLNSLTYGNINRIYRNLSEFTQLGFSILTRSEHWLGGTRTLNANIRKFLSDKPRIYINHLPKSPEDMFTFRESKLGRHAYTYLHKHEYYVDKQEFINYPNKDELLRLGYEEVPSIKCLKLTRVDSPSIDKNGIAGIHKTSKELMIELLLRNTYSTIIRNSVIYMREKFGVVFEFHNLEDDLVHLYREYKGYYGPASLMVEPFISNIEIYPVDNQELYVLYPKKALVVNIYDLVYNIQRRHLQNEDVPIRLMVRYDAHTARMVDRAIQNTKFGSLFGMMSRIAAETGLLYT